MRNISKTLENKTKVDERLTKTKNRLISASNSDIDKLLDSLNTTKRGIESEHIVEENQDEYGKNVITKKGSDNISKRLVRSFFNLFNIILIVLALVSCVVEIIIPILNKEKASYTTMIIILVMVFVSSIIHFVQEQKSATSANKLIQIIQTTSLIQRNGVLQEIPLTNIVVGDIIHLAAGDIIPADVRIIQAKDLFLSQSSLTGESEPIEKFAILDPSKNYDNITDRPNLAFMGSNIISGCSCWRWYLHWTSCF